MTPKQKAQEEIMFAAQVAFNRIHEDVDMTPKQKKVVMDQADKQFRRIEKMFGFVPGSWSRGV